MENILFMISFTQTPFTKKTLKTKKLQNSVESGCEDRCHGVYLHLFLDCLCHRFKHDAHTLNILLGQFTSSS